MPNVPYEVKHIWCGVDIYQVWYVGGSRPYLVDEITGKNAEKRAVRMAANMNSTEERL